MTRFEFITVAVSIVLGLSMARLLSAVPHIFDRDRRYWVHGAWVAALVPLHLGFWWAVWAYREIAPWTFPGFAVVMSTPLLLFLTVTALVSENPGTVPSWRERFYDRRPVFFALLLATAISSPLRQFVLLGDPEPSPGLGPPMAAALALVGAGAVGACISNESVHRGLALLVLATLAGTAATL